MVRKHFDLKDKKVLDFGAGTGANCSLSEPDYYYGIDPDERRVVYARRLYPEYRVDVFSGNKIPADNNSFDVILFIAVLHHIPPDIIPAYVKEFKRILK
jgi:SAM-dependent methyltransferase